MPEYKPWDDSWRRQIVYILMSDEIDAPVEVPADFTYPVFLGAFEQGVTGDAFWKMVAGAMVYVLGHEPEHPGAQRYVSWLLHYNPEIIKELIVDGAEQTAQGEWETGIWLLQAAILLDDQIREAHFNLGLAYYRLGLALQQKEKDKEGESCLFQAAQYLRNCLELDPNFSLAYHTLGNIYKQLGLEGQERKGMAKGLLPAIDKPDNRSFNQSHNDV